MPRPCGYCPKCGVNRNLTRHHINPIRHYGRKDNDFVFYLCRGCHDRLEVLIPFEPIPKHRYVEILLEFLQVPDRGGI